MAKTAPKAVSALAVTDRGIEQVLGLEASELVNAKASIEDSCVLFDVKTYDDLFKFTYLTQASDRVALFFGSFLFDDYDDLLKKSEAAIKKAGLKAFFKEGCSFKVFCERRGLHEFSSQVVEQELGGFVIDKIKEELGFEPRVELKLADTILFVFVNSDKAYLGIDLAGRDLSKRHYRIFTAPGVVNAKLAFAMARLANYNKKQKLVDLYSKAGIVAIEAALRESKTSVNFYDKDFAFKRIPCFKEKDWDSFFKKIDSARKLEKLQITGFDPLLRNLEAGKRNAKLAGIDKIISFSKLDLGWADAKLDQSAVDVVVSRIPCVSHNLPENAVRKIYKELFYQAEFFLKGNGKLCVLAESLALLREMVTGDFKVLSEERLWAGGQEYEFVILERLAKK